MKKFSLILAAMWILSLLFFNPAEAQTRLKFQSPFVPGTWDYMWGENFVKRVNALAAGRLEIKLEPPGAIVPAFEILDAVHKGVLDGGVAWSGYWVGKNTAFSLFASATGGPFGMNNWDHVAWIFAGGGQELYRELLDKLKYRVVWFPIWSEMAEPLGWFKKPIRSVADLKGLKMRAAGLAADVFREFGVAVTTLPMGEIMPALERGVIDAAEFSDPHSDMAMGFQDICKFYHLPGIHQPTGVGEAYFNKAVWDKLPADLRVIIELAAHEAMMLNWVRAWEMNIKALEDLQTKHGVTVVETPREILVEFLKAWDKVAARESAKNPDFAKVYESMRKFASRHVPYQRTINPDYAIAADYYWPKKK
ncbi:MAG: TRAP transporter substrate-binding protein [Thermodesulfobacteriota bacterium]|nr:TRAP transporter substrate-binding protein [Thermodesulfobacteriota bacterium]